MTCKDLLLSCEHGGNRVPAAYRALFPGPRAARALESHRGWDPGALDVARAFARRVGAPLFEGRVTRLLVELNRSPHHPRLFSEFSARLPPAERAMLLARHYYPYRDAVERAIGVRVGKGQAVLHLSVHTFVGTWHDQAREAEIGLLYDPARPGERHFCAEWRDSLQAMAPYLRVRRNYPYRGVSDGLVTHLRRRFSARRYVAIELEVCQTLVAAPGAARRETIAVLVDSFLRARSQTMPPG